MYARTSRSDATESGGSPRPEFDSCQRAKVAAGDIASISLEKISRTDEVVARSTGETGSPSSQVDFSRKNFETCAFVRAVTGFAGFTMIL